MSSHLQIILIIFGFISASCLNAPKNRQWFDCYTTLDTTEIVKDWTRGAYLVNDSLVLTTGCHPFDKSFCNTIDLRIEPIISYHGEHICSLADLYPPFKIYKPRVSDTLIVIKDNKVIFFKIPADLCENHNRIH